MCLIIFAHQPESRFPLVVAANRDEFFSRPTRQAQFWSDEPCDQSILAGKDLQAGGTWLGITHSGRFAAVTNIRDPSQAEQKPRSRGDLTREFLSSDQTAKEYCASLQDCFDDFAGYNLLIGDGQSMYYVNNFKELVQELEPGLYGLSNGILNSAWPKVSRGREFLQSLLESDTHLTSDALLGMMDNRTQAKDEDLPDTGIPKALEKQLSSAFIENTERQYGTLCSTAIIVEASGTIRFSEQNYDQSGLRTTRHFYEFTRQG